MLKIKEKKDFLEEFS